MRCGRIPAINPKNRRRSTLAGFLKFSFLGALLINLAGCGASLNLVKKDNLNPSYLSSAIAKAFTFGSGKSSQVSNRPGVYPPIPLEANEPRVRKFLREYGYEHRNTTRNYLAQGQKFLPMVKEQTREHHLPQELAYLFLLESGANPEARSRANALGMWQFMPATARTYGLRVDSYVDERLDPAKSTNAALLYLKDLYGMFGCWRLALSAYNSGENKLNRVLCKEDANEYEDICSSRMLKRETKEFLPRFQAITIIAKSPEKYGFQRIASKKSDEKFELAPIQGSYSLDRLAHILGISYADLLELNPALVRGVTPTDGSPYSVRVPPGKKDILLAGLRNIPEDKPKSQIIHVVKRGDTVKGIIRKYGVPKEMLVQLNPDVNLSRRLKRGVKITVPKIPVKKKVVSKTNGITPKNRPKLGTSAKKS
ncbi:MAG: transglycosylase SLT domain-containing protein [Desulfomonilaceae bacterium]